MVRLRNRHMHKEENGIKNIRRTAKTYVRIACAALIAVAILPIASLAADNVAKDPTQKDPLAIVTPEQPEGAQPADPSTEAPPQAEGTTPDAAKPDGTPGAPDAEKPDAEKPQADKPAPGTPDAEKPQADKPAPGTPDAEKPGTPGSTDTTKPPADANVDSNATDKPQATDEAPQPAVVPGAPAAEGKNAPSATPNLLGDPPGFSWRFRSNGDGTCKLVGFDGGPYSGVTVHVPAASPNGDIVTSIAKGLTGTGGDGITDSQKLDKLTCNIDFFNATNLKSIEEDAFRYGRLTGSLDFSKCKNLTQIDRYAFQNADNITSLKLPPNIKTIGEYAFMSQTSKISGTLTLPNSLTNLGQLAFYGCKFTGTLTLPDQLTSLETKVFSGCKFTGTLKIPKSITSLKAGAFQYCKFETITFPSDATFDTIGSNAFQDNAIKGVLTLPSSVTSINAYAFENNVITEVIFGTTNPITIQNNAFENNLIEKNPISPKHSFALIGQYAFASNNLQGSIDLSSWNTTSPNPGVISNNPDITDVTVSPKWGYIAPHSFEGLTKLRSISFGSNPKLTWVGEGAFQNCPSLEKIDFNGAPLIDGTYHAIGDYAFKNCSALKDVTLGNADWGKEISQVNITVGVSAFENCTSLYSIDLPANDSDSLANKKLVTNIGDYAFHNTNLGAFPNPAAPFHVLPLEKRALQSIGAHAFDNAGLERVELPTTLAHVGDGAFANNHMTNLDLPSNDELTPATVGADILANQTVDNQIAYYGEDESDPTQAFIILEAFHAFPGWQHANLYAPQLKLLNGTAIPNLGWAGDKALFLKSDLLAQGTSFAYRYHVCKVGKTDALSEGDVTLTSIEKGKPYTFNYYPGDAQNPGSPDTHVQWSSFTAPPKYNLNDVPNFGYKKAGYHTGTGAYSTLFNPDGWRTGSGPKDGTSMDPENQTVPTSGIDTFYNFWKGDSYSVTYNDNWDAMVKHEPLLGDPNDTTIRNPEWVSGSMADQAGFTYGQANKALRPNAFKMGAYHFDGWATSPKMAVADRVPGVNFFADGAKLMEPKPAPADGKTLILYAQWSAFDYGDSAKLAGFLSIPEYIELKPYGDNLFSTPDLTAPDNHNIELLAKNSEKEMPGAIWPKNEYKISLVRPSAGASLVSIVTEDGGGQTKAIDVYDSAGAIYDPDSSADPSNPTPLVTIDPHVDGQKSGTFFLKSEDPAHTFLPNADYRGTMTFRIDTIAKGTPS